MIHNTILGKIANLTNVSGVWYNRITTKGNQMSDTKKEMPLVCVYCWKDPWGDTDQFWCVSCREYDGVMKLDEACDNAGMSEEETEMWLAEYR
jgi:hypothetical protein